MKKAPVSAPDKKAPLQHEVVSVDPSTLKPHPKNYREHPQEQLDHIKHSLQQHGVYRNVVVARDGTILAGHGVVMAMMQMGSTKIPVIRIDIDPDDTTALKILTGDNELGRFAEVDDRALSELLKRISDDDIAGLVGTGYDEKMLANLVFVTRPKQEIDGDDDAEAWAGMPDYGDSPIPFKLVLICDSQESREDVIKMLKVNASARGGGYVMSARWPPAKNEDLSSVEFSDEAAIAE